jgi:hypothetical protein
MAKEVKLIVPRDKAPFDPFRTIVKIHWGGTRSLGVSLQIFPDDAFLVSASGGISINGTTVAAVVASPPVGAGCGAVLTPAQIAACYAPDPVPEFVTIGYTASWFVQDAIPIQRSGTMFCSADTYTSAAQSELIDNVTSPAITSLSGGSFAISLEKATYQLS